MADKKTELNTKQRKFIAEVAQGKSGTQAAISAGYAPESAHVQSSRLLSNDNVLKSLKEVFVDKGLNEEFLTDRLKELAEAKASGKPDWTARARGLDMAFKLRGDYAPLRVDVGDSRDEAELNASFIALFQELVPGFLKHFQGKAIEKRVIEINPVRGE